MDKEQKELQSLGFFGIWRGSFKIISTWSQVFLRGALALTLPLSFVYLAHIEISHLLSQNISRTLNTLATIASVTDNTTSYVLDPNNNYFHEMAGIILLRDVARYALFYIAYIIFHLITSFLPAGVIYTVACIYSGKSVTVKEVMYIIPKVWKRLMANFLCIMGIVFVYTLVFNSILFITILAHPIDPHSYIAKYDISNILSSIGVWYMDVIWQLANTISVLEESCGLEALRKSKQLLKGKMIISFAIISVCKLLFNGTICLFTRFVVVDRANVGMIGRVGFGVISLLLLSFVCKSYHNEQIDKFTFTGHLEVDHGEGYLCRNPEDGQLMESGYCI